MRHDRSGRVEVALVPASTGRSGSSVGDRDRNHHDLSQFVSISGGGPGRGMRREAHSKSTPSRASRSLGKQTVIMLLRLMNGFCLFLIPLLVIVSWWL